MKSASSTLHGLIRSLTATEKRYIRKSAMDKDSAALKLMDAIAKQQKYDEPLLRKNHKNASFIKNLAVNKQYLYDYICNALVQYRRKEKEINILHQAASFLMLHEKGLAESRPKALDKQITISKELGLYSLALELLHIKKRQATNLSLSEFRIIQTIETDLQKDIALENAYWDVLIQIRIASRAYQDEPSDALRKPLESWLRDPLIYEKKGAIHVVAELYFYESQILLFDALDKKEKAHEYKWEYIKLLDKKPKYLHRFSNKYAEIYLSIINDYFDNGEEELAMDSLKYVRDIKHLPSFKRTAKLKFNIFIKSYEMELAHYRAYAEFNKITPILSDLKKDLELNESYLSVEQKLGFCYHAAYACFCEKKYEASLEWVKTLIEYKKTDIIPDELIGARLIELIALFEIKQHRGISEKILETRKYIRKHRLPSASEKHLFDFLASAIESYRFSQVRMLNFQLLELLIKEKRNKIEKAFTPTFDLVRWCENRIS